MAVRSAGRTTGRSAVRDGRAIGGPGHTVRQSRLATGLSLRELARRIGVSAATLHAIETGKTELAVSRLREIAEVLDIAPAQLLDASGGAPGAGTPAHAVPAGSGRGTGERGDWRSFGPLRLDPVLAAAITSFVRTGYHGATMRSIARLAGISVPGVYHHYASKQELLVITLDLAMDDLTWRLLAAARDGGNGGDGTDGSDRVRLMVEALALFHTHRWELAFIGASEMRSLEPGNRRRIAELRNHVQHLLDDAIDAAIADGALRTPTPRHAGRAIATMCTSLPQWFRLGGPTTPERIATEYAQFALGLLGHPPVAPPPTGPSA
ncbi:MAG TPA: TetR family transcriptional regulator [Pseudonocardia sp.]|nr:TetR family transcriptional regulator [Pseudonocardia sp.]